MEGSLGKLLVSIGTDTKDLATGLGQAQKQIQGFQQTANKVLGLIGFSLTAGALMDLTKKTIEYGDQLNKMSEQTGLAASEIAKLKYVAEQSDTSLEAVAGTFRFLSRAMNEAKNGNAEAIQTFSRFHVEFQNADGTLRNYRDVMLDVADRIHNTSNQTVVLAESQKLLGRNVQQVLPLFKEGSEGIRRMTGEYEAMQKKIGLTDAQINAFAKNSDALGDSWKSLSTAFQFMLIEVLTPLIPKMEAFVKVLTDTDWKSIGDGLSGVVGFFADIAKSIDWIAKNLVAESDLFGMIFGKKASQAAAGTGPETEFPQLAGGSTPPQTVDLGTITVPGGPAPSPAAVPSTQGIGGPGEGNGLTQIFGGEVQKKMDEFKASFKSLNEEVGKIWGDTVKQLSTGFGTAMADSIVDGKNFGDAMTQVMKDLAKSVIAELTAWIAQLVILFVWQTMTGTTGAKAGGGFMKRILGFKEGGAILQARQGLLYGANGFAATGNMGEGGIPAVLHPNEIVSPIDKFFDAIHSMGSNQFVFNVTGAAADDPQMLAELVAVETDRRRRRP